MKVFAIQITLNGNPESIFIKTNADASKVKNFTIIDVIKPNGIGDLPIRAGLVMNYSELLDKIALSDAMGLISVSAVKVQDGDDTDVITSELPTIKTVTVSVSNTGAILKINGKRVVGLTWVGYLHAGESVTYEASKNGYVTQSDTLTVSSSNITESITLVELKHVSISVTNEGATLKIDNVAQSGLSWEGDVAVGDSVDYEASLEGYTTQSGTVSVTDAATVSDLTVEIKLVSA